MQSVLLEYPLDLDVPYSPEQVLFCAILDRAYRDLWLVPRDERHFTKKAIQWFEHKYDKYKGVTYISYKDCIAYLNLGAGQIAFLAEEVERAKIRFNELRYGKKENQFQAERKQDREGARELVERERRTLCA